MTSAEVAEYAAEATEEALRFLRGEPLRQEVSVEEYDYQRGDEASV